MKQAVFITLSIILFAVPALAADKVVVIPLNKTIYKECPADLTDCAGACVDILTNPDYCGNCETACNADQYCENGICTNKCPGNLTDCAGVCADIMNDPDYCGTCETACTADQYCDAGICKNKCPFDPCQSTPCGANTNCTGDAVCDFTCSCNAPWDDCNGDIGQGGDGCETDLNTNTANCGSCGNICPTGASCVDGNCECPAGQTVCNNACVDTSNDMDHCGGCNTGCVAGVETCVAGQCTSSSSVVCDQGDCGACTQSTCANDLCATERDACLNNQECVDFNVCVSGCTDQACLQGCQTSYPTGATLYFIYADCAYCTACPVDCAATCPIL